MALTLNQINKNLDKISNIKNYLKYEKRQFGGYDDGNGYRYIPPSLYIEIEDFKGALKYLNWFHKNFDDDSCYPEFFFDWTFILFKNKKLKEAEKKVFTTFCSNTFIFDVFFEIDIIQPKTRDIYFSDTAKYLDNFKPNFNQKEYYEFGVWLTNILNSTHFIEFSNQYIKLQEQLLINDDNQKLRIKCLNELGKMREQFD